MITERAKLLELKITNHPQDGSSVARPVWPAQCGPPIVARRAPAGIAAPVGSGGHLGSTATGAVP
jgi:hypothetical protein